MTDHPTSPPGPDRLRRQAKTLRRAFAAGETAARARVHAVLPEATVLRHTEALHVLAREQGHASWPRLKVSHDLAAMDRAARAERLKLALFHGQGWIVEHLLAADPELPSDNLGLLCALHDVDAVRAHLDRAPDAATRIVGVRSPMLHLCFSRYHRIEPNTVPRMLALADLLLAHGADVNDSYNAGGAHPLSALYGALGHAGNLPLAAWLLEHGATPDDNESLYHATELGHLDGVRLLMRHGVTTRGTNALNRMLDFDNLEGVRLLLDYGADPNEAAVEHADGSVHLTTPALHHGARRGRSGAFAELLLTHGAVPTATLHGHTAYAVARMIGNRSFADALDRAGHATPLTETEALLAACADGQIPPGQPLKGRDLGPEATPLLCNIIAWPNALSHIQCLVAAGVDANTPDGQNLTPLEMAGWHGLPDRVAWLLTQNPDLAHVNGFGGELLDTIAHGASNAPRHDGQDHLDCARRVLEAGAILRPALIQGTLDEDMAAFLHQWAEDHPGSLRSGSGSENGP